MGWGARVGVHDACALMRPWGVAGGCGAALPLLGLLLTARPEAAYTAAWCTAQGGQVEVRLADGTRADCVTPTHAVEVERAHRWYEAVGQALHYAQLTGRPPGIVLIVERPADCRYLRRLRAALQPVRVHGRPIRVWTTGPAFHAKLHAPCCGV